MIQKYAFFCVLFSILINGCYNDPVYETRNELVDVTKTRTVEKTRYLDVTKTKIKIRNPYFSISTKNPSIAIIPFTESAERKGAGSEICSELEFRMIRRCQDHSRMTKSELINNFKNIINNTQYNYFMYNVETTLSNWADCNKLNTYTVLSRDRIKTLLIENKIYDNMEEDTSIIKNNNILGIDCIITGHVKKINDNNTSFILKAIDARNSVVFYTERYEGRYNETIDRAIDHFFYNIVEDGVITIQKPETYTEIETYTDKELRPKTVKVKDGGLPWDFWLLVIAVGLAISAGS